MEYNYEFLAVEPADLYIQVKYSKVGFDDVVRKLGATDFSLESLTNTAEYGAYFAVQSWNATKATSNELAVPAGVIHATYSEPVAQEVVEVRAEQPAYDPLTHRVVETMTQPSEFLIEWSWEVIPLTEEEQVAALDNLEEQVRWERGERLRITDHWMLSDTPEPTQAQLDYRQALRDVPQQAGFPQNIEWPTL